MKIIRWAAAAILAVSVIACSSEDDTDEESELSAEQWCEFLWEELLAPADWGHDRFMRDCMDGLDAGFTRPMTREIYEDIKANEG